MRNFLARLILVMLCLGCVPAFAQTAATVVNTCGTLGQAYTAGSNRPITQDTTGTLCTVGGGGGGGGAVTIIDGGDVTQGAIADAVVAAGAAGTDSAKLRAISRDIGTVATNSALPLPAQSTNAVNIGATMNAGSAYETVAASQTGQALGATGATGDYLSHCVLYPVSTSPGVVTVFDSTSTTTNNVITFAGGSSSLSTLAPIAIPVGAVSLNGAWKVTTGANVLVICYGKFT